MIEMLIIRIFALFGAICIGFYMGELGEYIIKKIIKRKNDKNKICNIFGKEIY